MEVREGILSKGMLFDSGVGQMRKRKTRSLKNPYSVSEDPELWAEYDEELINMNESLFIDRWHDTCEILPDCENVWFIAEGKICVGIYDPEQTLFCMADGFGVELKNVRQWKYVSEPKMIARFPREKQIVAASVRGLPCLAAGIFTDHCIDEESGDEISALVLDHDMGPVDFSRVEYWYPLPEAPKVIKEPVGNSLLAAMPVPQEIVDTVSSSTPSQENDTEAECPCEKDEDAFHSSIVRSLKKGRSMEESIEQNMNIKKIKEGKTVLKSRADLRTKRRMNESNTPGKSDKVGEWYRSSYPEDSLGEEIDDTVTFEEIYDALKKGKDVYDKLGVGDSIIRERVFEGISKAFSVDYDEVYDAWLNGGRSNSSSSTSADVEPADKGDKDKIGLKWIEDYRKGLLDLPEIFRKLLYLFDGDYKATVEWLDDAWDRPMKESRMNESRIYYELRDGNYTPWSGAVDTWNTIVDNDKLDEFDVLLEENYPEGLEETQLNDLLWFEREWIFENLGIKEEEDEDDEETEL